jgi:hypothetical protein
MKLRAQVEGLGMPAIVATANLPVDTLVSITGNGTVGKCAADGFPIGRLSVPAKTANGPGTVETKFKELVEMEADGSITAGDWVKLGTLSPTTGKHTAKVWTEGTAAADNDPVKRAYGVCWVGGADEATVQILTF